jgi:hypothetical protein
MAMNSTVCKLSLWLRYVDDIFIMWKHSMEDLHNFLNHLNNLRTSIKFTMEMEVNGHLPFLDVLVTKKEGSLTTTVYRKPTHTGTYIHHKSNHLMHLKRGVVQGLVH